MRGTCDWLGCTAPATIGYRTDPARPRELCQKHWEEYCEIQERLGRMIARRKLDAKHRREGIPEELD